MLSRSGVLQGCQKTCIHSVFSAQVEPCKCHCRWERVSTDPNLYNAKICKLGFKIKTNF